MLMENRSSTDRRSIKDRRKAINFHCLYTVEKKEGVGKIEGRNQKNEKVG